MNPTDRMVRLLKKDVKRLKRDRDELIMRIERLESLPMEEKPHQREVEWPRYDGDGKPLDIHGNTWNPKEMNEGENH